MKAIYDLISVLSTQFFILHWNKMGARFSLRYFVWLVFLLLLPYMCSFLCNARIRTTIDFTDYSAIVCDLFMATTANNLHRQMFRLFCRSTILFISQRACVTENKQNSNCEDVVRKRGEKYGNKHTQCFVVIIASF